jgi:endonuclease YncB( thermonuclease family)
MIRIVISAIAVFLALPCAAADIMGQATVIDGDTIEIHDRRIRLFGIDAPEAPQTCTANGKTYLCGQQAALALADKIGRGVVNCEQRDIDRYGRIVAICFAGGVDLGSWLVERGWALAFRRYSTTYVTQEQVAESAGRGMWRGEFVMPWEWRRGKR